MNHIGRASEMHSGVFSQGFFHEMVSDAVGAKVLGKRSKGTLSAVSKIGCVENKAKSGLTSRRIPMSSVWRARN